jgi:hypothetical protein
MPIGGPVKPPINPTPKYIEKFIEERKVNANKNMSMVKLLKDPDYKYLWDSFQMLKESYDQKGIKDKHPKGQELRRYTPRQMFDNCVKYIENTLKASQPLTITGMGLFMGFHRVQIFEMLNTKTGQRLHEYPEYSFIFDFADFIEMYNEYAAHKKQNPAGPIFILKNFGWKDKFEIEASATQGAMSDEEREAAQKRISEFSEVK